MNMSDYINEQDYQRVLDRVLRLELTKEVDPQARRLLRDARMSMQVSRQRKTLPSDASYENVHGLDAEYRKSLDKEIADEQRDDNMKRAMSNAQHIIDVWGLG
jgi:hypothetical protein